MDETCANSRSRKKEQLSGNSHGRRGGKWIAYILTQPNGNIAQLFANGVVNIVDTVGGGHGKPIEATKGIGARYLSWAPTEFLSVSPSAEKQTVLWGQLKQKQTNN